MKALHLSPERLLASARCSQSRSSSSTSRPRTRRASTVTRRRSPTTPTPSRRPDGRIRRALPTLHQLVRRLQEPALRLSARRRLPGHGAERARGPGLQRRARPRRDPRALALRWSISRRRLFAVAVTLLAGLSPYLFEISRLVFEVALEPFLIALFLLVAPPGLHRALAADATRSLCAAPRGDGLHLPGGQGVRAALRRRRRALLRRAEGRRLGEMWAVFGALIAVRRLLVRSIRVRSRRATRRSPGSTGSPGGRS